MWWTATCESTTEPCGTLHVSATASDMPVCVQIIIVCPERYELNYAYAWSITPSRSRAHPKTCDDAPALKSKNTSAVTRIASVVHTTSLCKMKSVNYLHTDLLYSNSRWKHIKTKIRNPTYIFPFSTNVRPSAKDHNKSSILSRGEKLAKILLSFEVILAWHWFMCVPCNVSATQEASCFQLYIITDNKHVSYRKKQEIKLGISHHLQHPSSSPFHQNFARWTHELLNKLHWLPVCMH